MASRAENVSRQGRLNQFGEVTLGKDQLEKEQMMGEGGVCGDVAQPVKFSPCLLEAQSPAAPTEHCTKQVWWYTPVISGERGRAIRSETFSEAE